MPTRKPDNSRSPGQKAQGPPGVAITCTGLYQNSLLGRGTFKIQQIVESLL